MRAELMTMRVSQVENVEVPRKRLMLTKARIRESCTASSASSQFLVMLNAAFNSRPVCASQSDSKLAEWPFLAAASKRASDLFSRELPKREVLFLAGSEICCGIILVSSQLIARLTSSHLHLIERRAADCRKLEEKTSRDGRFFQYHSTGEALYHLWWIRMRQRIPVLTTKNPQFGWKISYKRRIKILTPATTGEFTNSQDSGVRGGITISRRPNKYPSKEKA